MTESTNASFELTSSNQIHLRNQITTVPVQIDRKLERHISENVTTFGTMDELKQGTRVSIFWNHVLKRYEGTINKVNMSIEYDDGDVEKISQL